MGLLVASLVLAAAQPVAEPPVENEITVIGNRLRDWRGKWKVRKGVPKCKTTRSTGDKAIDAIGCNAMTVCMAPIIPQWEAIHDAKLSRSELKSQINALMVSANVGVCVRDTRKAGIDALIAERRSKRT
jgi:hypothetical protein